MGGQATTKQQRRAKEYVRNCPNYSGNGTYSTPAHARPRLAQHRDRHPTHPTNADFTSLEVSTRWYAPRRTAPTQVVTPRRRFEFWLAARPTPRGPVFTQRHRPWNASRSTAGRITGGCADSWRWWYEATAGSGRQSGPEQPALAAITPRSTERPRADIMPPMTRWHHRLLLPHHVIVEQWALITVRAT